MTHRDMGFASSTMAGDQHVRLLLVQLPFRTVAEFDDWIGSEAVAGSWWEFVTDFYKHNASDPEPDKTRTARCACNALNHKTPRFLIHHPSKEDWTPEDHHVRFIVTVIHDSILQGVWSEANWAAKGIHIAEAVFEVLSYLRFMSRGAAKNMGGKGYSDADTDVSDDSMAGDATPSYSSGTSRSPTSWLSSYD
jgi:hypothetical protein